LESAGKRAKGNESCLSPELMQKISSWKLVPYKEREYGSALTYYSPKKAAERDIKVIQP
jgi:hypothetical protein